MLRKSLKVPDQTIGVISIHKILSHLRYTAKTGLWQIFQLSIFSFSAKKNAITKATEQATIDFSFRILVFFPFWEVLNVTVCKPLEFFSVLAAIIRQPHFYCTARLSQLKDCDPPMLLFLYFKAVVLSE